MRRVLVIDMLLLAIDMQRPTVAPAAEMKVEN